MKFVGRELELNRIIESEYFTFSLIYGRVDLTINLRQMDYYESSLFYPNYSEEDKVKIYSVFGGIPYYNRLIDDSKSIEENIIELIASSGARLENGRGNKNKPDYR